MKQFTFIDGKLHERDKPGDRWSESPKATQTEMIKVYLDYLKTKSA